MKIYFEEFKRKGFQGGTIPIKSVEVARDTDLFFYLHSHDGPRCEKRLKRKRLGRDFFLTKTEALNAFLKGMEWHVSAAKDGLKDVEKDYATAKRIMKKMFKNPRRKK